MRAVSTVVCPPFIDSIIFLCCLFGASLPFSIKCDFSLDSPGMCALWLFLAAARHVQQRLLSLKHCRSGIGKPFVFASVVLALVCAANLGNNHSAAFLGIRPLSLRMPCCATKQAVEDGRSCCQEHCKYRWSPATASASDCYRRYWCTSWKWNRRNRQEFAVPTIFLFPLYGDMIHFYCTCYYYTI